eukprot:761216-Hanusia_phi.AAC.1
MAIGQTSSSHSEIPSYVCYVDPTQENRRRSQVRRAIVASALVAVALCAAVMLLFSNQPAPARRSLLAMKRSASRGQMDIVLAAKLIKAAPSASFAQLSTIVDNWKSNQIVNFDRSGRSTQMLAFLPENVETALQESGQLCAKKDFIFQKFNQLLNKLKDESTVRNQTDHAAYVAEQEALKAWLDGESAYRLELEKEKEAKDGSQFARAELEKWKATVKQTEERLKTMTASYTAEKADIQSERELLKEILRILGVLEDQPLDDRSKAAGGYTAQKSSQAVAMKEIRAKIAQLKQRATLGGPLHVKQVTMLQQKLANFAETDEVRKLLEAMLADLDSREGVIDRAYKETQDELEQHKDKVVEYEKEVVDLSNAADKAKQRADAKDLQRQSLNGKKINSEEEYKNEHASYLIVAPPADRAIYILHVIMDKIDAFCKNGGNAASPSA